MQKDKMVLLRLKTTLKSVSIDVNMACAFMIFLAREPQIVKKLSEIYVSR